MVSTSTDRLPNDKLPFLAPLLCTEITDGSRLFRDELLSILLAERHMVSSDMQLEWWNLRYECGGKALLNGVQGRVASGSLTAIIGPSGAGKYLQLLRDHFQSYFHPPPRFEMLKRFVLRSTPLRFAGKTTLLRALSARLTGDSGLKGSIALNGRSVLNDPSFRKRVAFVPQRDELYPYATPREALAFSASLLLPTSLPREHREVLVTDTLLHLGLEKCEGTFIGNELAPGISGGEKKRTAIGCALVGVPELIFLDEPTSGLDSYAALQICKVLRELSSRSNAPVLCSVHAPSSDTFALFDQVIVLSDGVVVYHGPTLDMVAAFGRRGLECPPHVNPAEWLLILCQTHRTEDIVVADDDTTGVHRDTVLVSTGASCSSVPMAAPVSCCGTDGACQLPSIFPAWVLLKRELRGIPRDWPTLRTRFGIGTVLYALIGSAYQGSARLDTDSTTTALVAYNNCMYALAIISFMRTYNPCLLFFAAEKQIFLQEHSTGHYSSCHYLVAKMAVELPFRLLEVVVAYLIVYWLVGLRGSFFELVLDQWAMQVATNSMALLLGAVTRTQKNAVEMGTLLFGIQLFACGFFIPIKQLPTWLRWINHISVVKYGAQLMLLTEFGPECAHLASDVSRSLLQVCAELMESNNITSNMGRVRSFVILCAIFVLCRLMAVIALAWKAKRMR